MKFSCDKYVLLTAVGTAGRAASPKSPMPILEGLLIAAGAGVRVTGYDLRKGIYTEIEADVAQPGSVVVNAKLFAEMLRRLPDGVVTVDVAEDLKVTVKCGKSEYSFMGLPSEDYPELPSAESGEMLAMSEKLLAGLINDTVFAVSQNESRPVYMGSLFEIENGELAVVSVDGYRLALRREKLENMEGRSMRFIIPGTALIDIQRICGDKDDEVRISVGDKHASFAIGSTVVIARRLEGDFLNYKKSIPEVFRHRMEIDRDEFLSAVDRVSLVVDERVKNPVRLIFGEERIDFLCVTPLGRAEDVCYCKGSGEDTEIGFNDRFLRDALRAASKKELEIAINTGSSPCVITPADGSGEFTYMILPVRLHA